MNEHQSYREQNARDIYSHMCDDYDERRHSLLAVGDLEGRMCVMDAVMRFQENTGVRTVFLGDVIDREWKSSDHAAAMSCIVKNKIELVLGNHETTFMRGSIDNLDKNGDFNGDIFDTWMNNGGNHTLSSVVKMDVSKTPTDEIRKKIAKILTSNKENELEQFLRYVKDSGSLYKEHIDIDGRKWLLVHGGLVFPYRFSFFDDMQEAGYFSKESMNLVEKMMQNTPHLVPEERSPAWFRARNYEIFTYWQFDEFMKGAGYYGIITGHDKLAKANTFGGRCLNVDNTLRTRILAKKPYVFV